MQKFLIVICLFCFISTHQLRGQSKPDTLYYEIQQNMIEEAKIHKMEKDELTSYQIGIQLKEKYHKEFERLTENNIGNFLAIRYKDEIISPNLPTIRTKIRRGIISVGSYEKQKEAKNILQLISD